MKRRETPAPNTSMLLFLDSASLNDAREAAQMGYIAGITTNPTLMALEAAQATDQIPKLLESFPGLVFHQPVSLDPAEIIQQFRVLHETGAGRVVAKLPATPSLFPVASQLRTFGMACAITAIVHRPRLLFPTRVAHNGLSPSKSCEKIDAEEDLQRWFVVVND